MNEQLPDHIEEYIKNSSNDEKFLDLFESDNDNVNMRTELTFQEVVLLNKLSSINEFIKTKFNNIGESFSPYSLFMYGFMKNKISLERKSRTEFVDINRKDRFEQNLRKFGDFANISKVKE